MKKTVVTLTICFLFLGSFLYGIYCQNTYDDFNKMDNPLDIFNVGILSEDMCERQVEHMRALLPESNIIIAAEVQEGFYFMPGCTTQKVKVKKIFKGDCLSEGEEINVVFSQGIFFLDDERPYTEQIPRINMGFASEMDVGETYLIFLQNEIETDNHLRLFIIY